MELKEIVKESMEFFKFHIGMIECIPFIGEYYSKHSYMGMLAENIAVNVQEVSREDTLFLTTIDLVDVFTNQKSRVFINDEMKDFENITISNNDFSKERFLLLIDNKSPYAFAYWTKLKPRIKQETIGTMLYHLCQLGKGHKDTFASMGERLYWVLNQNKNYIQLETDIHYCEYMIKYAPNDEYLKEFLIQKQVEEIAKDYSQLRFDIKNFIISNQQKRQFVKSKNKYFLLLENEEKNKKEILISINQLEKEIDRVKFPKSKKRMFEEKQQKEKLVNIIETNINKYQYKLDVLQKEIEKISKKTDTKLYDTLFKQFCKYIQNDDSLYYDFMNGKIDIDFFEPYYKEFHKHLVAA